MRPPQSATPPVSHVMSRQFMPTPGLTCQEDWRNLTSNNSIQILSLESSTCHEDSLLHRAEVSNQLKFVDTIISPKQEDAFLWQQATYNTDRSNENVSETIVTLDALTDNRGDTFDARIIFTPKDTFPKSRKRCLDVDQTAEKRRVDFSKCPRRLNRNFYSDSELHSNSDRLVTVTRSKSLSYAEYVRKKNDTSLVKPLRPCIYKSKIGGVKRIPSFRDTHKPVIVSTTQAVRNTVNPLVVISERCTIDKPTVTTRTIVGVKDGKNQNKNISISGEIANKTDSKISKLMKNGLKSVMKSNGNYTVKCTDSSNGCKNMTTLERRRYRKTRYGSDIGGLSDFLRRNERRKTVGVLTEKDKFENDGIQICERNGVSLKQNTTGSDFSTFTPDEDKNGRTQIMGSKRLHLTGTSNLKFNQCQRKLDFLENSTSLRPNSDNDHSRDPKDSVCHAPENTCEPRRRPRLGILSSSKPVNVISIDELEMDIVRDLKRRVEMVARRPKVKTNGSLKMKAEVKPICRSVVSSPWRLRENRPPTCRYNAKLVPLKRESTV